MNTINILLGAFMALMVLGGMATAADTTSVINANVQASVEVTAPNSLNLGNLNVGPNSLALGLVTVSSNAAKWQLSCSGNGYFNGFTNGAFNFLSVPTVNGQYYGSGSQDGSPVRADSGFLATGVAAGTFIIPVQLSVDVPVTAPIGATTTTETFTAGLY